MIDSLSSYLTQEYGRGFSRTNLFNMRKFYLAYRGRQDEIVQAQTGQLGEMDAAGIVQSRTGQFNMLPELSPFKLSWTHYVLLSSIEDEAERSFYELEAIRNAWDVKTLRHQYGSSLYERLALSRNKDDVMRLANEGATPQKPTDLLKTPYVLDFAGLADRASYRESDLEQAVIDRPQDFLLEMGKGFLFERRQKRFEFQDRDANIYAQEYRLYLPDKRLLQAKLVEWLNESEEV